MRNATAQGASQGFSSNLQMKKIGLNSHQGRSKIWTGARNYKEQHQGRRGGLVPGAWAHTMVLEWDPVQL